MTSSGRLANKVAIVTGSSSGLGRAIAIQYALEGAVLVCADLRPGARSEVTGETDANTDELIRQKGSKAIFVQTDVGVAADIEGLVAKTVAEYGRLDILVNNAGISIESKNAQPIHTTSEDTWDLTMQVNTKSIFLGCKYAITQMLRQDLHSTGDRGWIINISSILGLVAEIRSPSYCASKAAACGLTKQVALDYAAERIHCNAICPGYTQTAIYLNAVNVAGASADDLRRKHPFGGPGTPGDIARFAVTLASEDASWMTGACVPIDGGYTAH